MLYKFGSSLVKDLLSNQNIIINPNDIDLVTNNKSEYEYFKGMLNTISVPLKLEIYYIPCLPNRELSLNELYTVKLSHSLRSINWSKNMSYIRLFQINNAVIDNILYSELKSYWNEVYGIQIRTEFENFSSINEFFKDNVYREFSHDTLHKMVLKSPNDIPAYKYIVDELIPDQNKFLSLSNDIQLKILTEEAYVIALERYIKNNSIYTAYHKAQHDLITRLHPEWLAEYAILNWKLIYKPLYNFYDTYKIATTT